MKEIDFRAGAAIAGVRDIQREMVRQVQPLQAKLKTEKDKEKRAELKRQIKEIRGNYLQKEKEANYTMFNRQRWEAK